MLSRHACDYRYKLKTSLPEPTPKEVNPPMACQYATRQYQNPDKVQAGQVQQTVKQ